MHVSKKKVYSAWRLLREGLGGQRGWAPVWRRATPKSRYDVIVVGGGAHGLATAYYLAKNHGINRVAVLEKSWIGGGNSGRNTAVIRSNYYWPQSSALYEMALDLYEQMSRELNYNVMFSRRGIIVTAHSRHDLELMARLVGAMQVRGLDARMLSRQEIAARVPTLDCSGTARFPIVGGYVQERAGVARHDAVVWGYARAADSLGVDIIENCEVLGCELSNAGAILGVKTKHGNIAAERVVLVTAGHSSVLAAQAGVQLPITSYGLQAFVTEPLKPVLNCVVLSPATGLYVSQSDKGGLVFGGGLDRYPSYAQKGGLSVMSDVVGSLAEQFPRFGRVRVLRQWSGIVDVTPDSSPVLGDTKVGGLYLNCGWGTGGFKAVPAGGLLTAHHVATGQPHSLAKPFGLNRFSTGALIDEAAGAGIAH